MAEIRDFLKKHCLITLIVAEVFALAGIYFIYAEEYFFAALQRFILVLAMCPLLYLISGNKTFDASNKKTFWKTFKPLIIFSFYTLFMAVVGVAGMIFANTGLVSNWPLQLITMTIYVISVGFIEELVFRAIAFDAIMYKFRNSKHVFWVSALVISLFFGVTHVVGAEFVDAVSVVQAVLKTVSTALLGLGMLFMYWKTRNVVGIALGHALYDFFAFFVQAVFASGGEEAGNSYVATGASGVANVVIYIIQITALSIFCLVIYLKHVRKIDFNEMRKSW